MQAKMNTMLGGISFYSHMVYGSWIIIQTFFMEKVNWFGVTYYCRDGRVVKVERDGVSAKTCQQSYKEFMDQTPQ